MKSKELKNILLIDDSESDNYFHIRKIKSLGIDNDITVCYNGEEALNYLRNTNSKDYSKPDLIFVDINMPGMNGWEFLDEYNEFNLSKDESVLVYILSNSIDNEDKDRAKEYPVVKDYFSKPLGKEALEYIVEHYS